MNVASPDVLCAVSVGCAADAVADNVVVRGCGSGFLAHNRENPAGP